MALSQILARAWHRMWFREPGTWGCCHQEMRLAGTVKSGKPASRVQFPRGASTPEELRALIENLMRAHYRLLARKDFWYQKRLQEGSKILCVLASDMRVQLQTAVVDVARESR